MDAHPRCTALRHAVVAVQQDAFLFTTSLENNIAYGNPWAQPSQITDAGASAQFGPALDAAAAQIRSLAVSDEAFDRARFERVVERIRKPVADRLGRLVVVDADRLRAAGRV